MTENKLLFPTIISKVAIYDTMLNPNMTVESPENSMQIENLNTFNILNKKRIDTDENPPWNVQMNSKNNKNNILNCSINDNLNISGSTANNTINNTNNLINKFSPLPKPDFSSIERKENCLSYKNKGSYKKPKYTVPDSPIKTPHKFSSTPGNAMKFGKKYLKKTACRKLNFFGNDDEEEISSPNISNNLSSNFSNNLNFDNFKINTDLLKTESTNNPFFNFETQNKLSNSNFNNLKSVIENENNKKNKKKISFVQETSEFEINEPINYSESSKENVYVSPPKKSKNSTINSYSKSKSKSKSRFLNIGNSDNDDPIYEENEIEVSQFHLTKYNNAIANQSKLSLNESKNSPDFSSRLNDFQLIEQENNFTFNKKNFDEFWINSKNLKNKDEFLQNFHVSKFCIEDGIDQDIINTNPDYTNIKINSLNFVNNINKNNLPGEYFHVKEAKKLNFDSEILNDINYNDDFSSTNLNNFKINYDAIMNEMNELSKISSELTQLSKFDTELSIIRTLDSGSFGVVYLCISNQEKNLFAVKKTKKIIGKRELNNVNNLIFDLNLLSKFNCLSNYIVKYIEAWEEEGLMYIKQEFCPNGDLLDFLQKLEDKNFLFNSEFYWDIFFDMICGLKYFHETGYLHLDIKPQNFLVSYDGCIKLGDFNLSRKKNNNDDDYLEGDSSYLAPEIFEIKKFRQLNEKCDIFSLGLLFLEVLCKIELPQTGQLWHDIRSENFVIPREFFDNCNLKEIPKNMLNLIHDMIKFNPEERKDLRYILDNSSELKLRLEKLNNNQYIKSYGNFIKNIEELMNIEENLISRRTNSYN